MADWAASGQGEPGAKGPGVSGGLYGGTSTMQRSGAESTSSRWSTRSSPTLCGDCWSRRLAQSAAVDVSGGVSSIGRLRVRCPYFCPAGGQRQCALMPMDLAAGLDQIGVPFA